MKHLSVLIPTGNVIVDTIIGTHNLFEMANRHLQKNKPGTQDLFQIDFVGMTKESQSFGSYLSLKANTTYQEVSTTDLIIIPGLVGDMTKQIALNTPLINWIREQRIRNGSEIASLCRGAFLLAETGLLHGKSCATHWLTHNTFKQMFPNVELLPEKVINEDNGIYSSGGAYSFLNLLLHLIEKYYGRETAIWCAKVAQIDFDRNDQNQFAIFKGQKNHADKEVLSIQQYVEQHYAQKLRVGKLAEQMATSNRNFVRRFKKATHNTPKEYIQRVRIEAAKKQLESTTLNVHEVMYAVGYNDDKTFRTLFKRHAGLTPLDYRNKYNREMALG